jgi:hypothetical protein
MRLEAFGGGLLERPVLFLLLSDGSLLTYRATRHQARLRFVRFGCGWLAAGLLRPPGAAQVKRGVRVQVHCVSIPLLLIFRFHCQIIVGFLWN